MVNRIPLISSRIPSSQYEAPLNITYSSNRITILIASPTWWFWLICVTYIHDINEYVFDEFSTFQIRRHRGEDRSYLRCWKHNQWYTERLSAAKESVDNCIDSTAPSMFVVPNHPVTRAFRDLKERGIRLRFLLPDVIDIKELKVQITQEES